MRALQGTCIVQPLQLPYCPTTKNRTIHWNCLATNNRVSMMGKVNNRECVVHGHELLLDFTRTGYVPVAMSFLAIAEYNEVSEFAHSLPFSGSKWTAFVRTVLPRRPWQADDRPTISILVSSFPVDHFLNCTTSIRYI